VMWRHRIRETRDRNVVRPERPVRLCIVLFLEFM
jgi:hypothetical protein